MESITKKIIITLASLVCIFYASNFIDVNYYDFYRGKQVAENFFNNLVQKKYTDAAKNISYFNSATTSKIDAPLDEAQQIWVERVNTLHKAGTYAVSYKDLRVEKDNTSLTGRVTLTIVENSSKKDYRLIFFIDKTPKRFGITRFQLLYEPQITKNWMSKLSGDVPI